MSARDDVGRSLREFKARTGWTWAQVGEHFGTTGEYARKIARGAGSPGAGSGLLENARRVQATGRAQKPVQRQQRVRAPGGQTRPAEPRTAPSRRAFRVDRSVFAGPAGRDGWAVEVTVPKSGPNREAGRHAIVDATRRAAQGQRRVAFRVTTVEGEQHELGAHGGYSASRALAGMRREALDPFEWLADEFDGKYGVTAGGIGAVQVVALP